MQDLYIAMGTTPTISVCIKNNEGEPMDFNIIDISSFKFYFKQDNGKAITKGGSLVTVDAQESKVTTYLTQEDTLQFMKGYVSVEVRWLFKSKLPNDEQCAGKTEIISIPIGTVLKREVITNEQ